jgi:Fe-S-cluster containining protein
VHGLPLLSLRATETRPPRSRPIRVKVVTIEKLFWGPIAKIPKMLSRIRNIGKAPFVCQRCGTCCLNVFPLFRPDLVRLERRTNLSKMRSYIKVYLSPGEDPPKGIRLFLDAGQHDRYPTDPDRCPFLDGKNACSIYEDRPIACRRFPIGDKAEGNGICPHWNRKANPEMSEADEMWRNEEKAIARSGAEDYYKRWLGLLYPKGFIPKSSIRQGVFWTSRS